MKIAVCDDERAMRKRIVDLLHTASKETAVTEYGSALELLETDIVYDLIFLDIKMDGMTGIEAARILRRQQADSEIVFVTGLDEYVFDAFDIGAFHYLMKPVDKVTFLAVYEKAQEKCKEKKEVARMLAGPVTAAKSILVKLRSSYKRIFSEDIYLAEVRNRKVILYTKNGNLEYYARLSGLEKELGNNFYRCHRAYLVALEYVSEYNYERIVLENGMEADIAKQKYRGFVLAYLNYIKRMK